MADWKYIMFHDEKNNREMPVIFHNEMVHGETADGIRMANRHLRHIKPVSAGFVSLSVVSTFGRSETLDKESRDYDAGIMNILPYTGGLMEVSGMEPRIEKMLLLKQIEHLIARVKELP